MRKLLCSISLLVVSLLFASKTVLANDQLSADRLLTCKQIADDKKRLACYDESLANIALTSQKIDFAKPSKQKKKEFFGKEHKLIADKAKEISAKVASIKVSKRKLHTITLENGQQWLQKEKNNLFKLAIGNIVIIKRGALNSFHMNKKGSKRSIRVKRIN